jgi:hypothetical protein
LFFDFFFVCASRNVAQLPVNASSPYRAMPKEFFRCRFKLRRKSGVNWSWKIILLPTRSLANFNQFRVRLWPISLLPFKSIRWTHIASQISSSHRRNVMIASTTTAIVHRLTGNFHIWTWHWNSTKRRP